jgi:hypothetical protein
MLVERRVETVKCVWIQGEGEGNQTGDRCRVIYVLLDGPRKILDLILLCGSFIIIPSSYNQNSYHNTVAVRVIVELLS